MPTADDLTLKPDYAVEQTAEYKTLISQFENGVEQRRAKWSAPLRQWKLVFNNRSASDVTTIMTLFNNKKGSLTSFLWTCPIDSTQYTVRFAQDSITKRLINPGIYTFSFDLIQVK